MINEERFWESAIQEAVRNDPPPDVTARVLAGLAEPVPAATIVTPPRGKLRLLRVLAEVAVAAAVVFAIGWLTGIFRVPEEGAKAAPQNVAAAPGAQYEFNEGFIALNHGWLLVSTGAPDVHCSGSVLSQVDGQVLVHAAGVPTRGQAEAVKGWLEANKLEIDMVGEMKNWARGTVMAALVLSGSAMLDGQRIEGPQPVATTEWHVVRSVMDIDNLPKDARYVSAAELDAAHLDFLAEVSQLEGIRFTNSTGLRPDHLRSLKALKSLRWLDLRTATWSSDVEPDYEALKELPALKRVSLDFEVWQHAPFEGPTPVWSFSGVTLPTLKELSARGVEIELGSWNPETSEELRVILQDLPTLRSLSISYATAAEMKLLAAHEALKSLDLEEPEAGELGLAYLARKGTLEELKIRDGLSLDEVHQISRMNLRMLRIAGSLADSPQTCFERLAGMKSLRELELCYLEIPEDGLSAFKAFTGMQRLDRLRLEGNVASGFEVMVAHWIPTRRLELLLDYPPQTRLDEVPAELAEGQSGKLLEELRLECWGASFNPDTMDDQHAATLKSYPTLKRVEVRRGGFENPTEQDQFVAWLQKTLPGVHVVLAP
jgi:hypothetical protein